MGGGAWPFLVGGVICLVNSVNERDLDLLNSHARCPSRHGAVDFLEGLLVSNQSQEGNNRSVMPLDVLGRTRATLTVPESALPSPAGAGNLANAVVLGIDPCNFRS